MDESGATTDTYEYDVFGALRSSTGSSDQPYRFTGEYQDVGVVGDPYYLRARMYDAEAGRFLTTDQWAGSAPVPQTINPYAYVLGNPVVLIDPSGQCPVCPDISLPNPIGAIEGGLQAADDALGYVPGWNQAVGATHDFLYGPYRSAGDWLVERFGTQSCLSFALDLGGTAALALLGPYGVPVAAAAFATSVGVDSKEGDWFGLSSSGGAWLASPLTLEEFSKFAPKLGRVATRLGRVASLYSFGACLRNAL